MDRLRAGAQSLGLTLTDQQLATFQVYYQELVGWNKKFNLTAITEYDQVQVRHFVDSLSCMLALPRPLCGRDGVPLHCIDVGSGAGFPGLPLKIYCSRLQFVLLEATANLVREESEAVFGELERMRRDLEGRRAAVYVGGSFKAFSLVKALRLLGMETVVVGSQTGNKADYEYLKSLCAPGTIIVDDTNPLELTRFLLEKDADLLVGGVKERPLAYKLGVAFCDHNHERKIPLAGFEGMLHFAREVHASVTSPVWKFAARRRGKERNT